jgi:26S proteasome regulatory subunit N12
MAPQQLAALYNDLQRAFDARPSNLQRCGSLLAQLKVLNFQAHAEASF